MGQRDLNVSGHHNNYAEVSMLPKVVPLSQQIFDWNGLVTFLKETIGPEPVRKVDEYGYAPGSPVAYIGLLMFALKGNDNSLVQMLRQGDPRIIKHLFFSFAAYHDEVDFAPLILENSDLDVCSREKVCIVSGSLDKWRQAILEFCQSQYDFEIRFLFNCMLLHFEHTGLQEIWNNYGKQRLKDQTLVLKHK